MHPRENIKTHSESAWSYLGAQPKKIPRFSILSRYRARTPYTSLEYLRLLLENYVHQRKNKGIFGISMIISIGAHPKNILPDFLWHRLQGSNPAHPVGSIYACNSRTMHPRENMKAYSEYLVCRKTADKIQIVTFGIHLGSGNESYQISMRLSDESYAVFDTWNMVL